MTHPTSALSVPCRADDLSLWLVGMPGQQHAAALGVGAEIGRMELEPVLLADGAEVARLTGAGPEAPPQLATGPHSSYLLHGACAPPRTKGLLAGMWWLCPPSTTRCAGPHSGPGRQAAACSRLGGVCCVSMDRRPAPPSAPCHRAGCTRWRSWTRARSVGRDRRRVSQNNCYHCGPLHTLSEGRGVRRRRGCCNSAAEAGGRALSRPCPPPGPSRQQTVTGRRARDAPAGLQHPFLCALGPALLVPRLRPVPALAPGAPGT